MPVTRRCHANLRVRPASRAAAWVKAARTARWAVTMTKWRIAFEVRGRLIGSRAVPPSHRWRFLEFTGPNGGESRGVVDLVAMRRCYAPCRAPLKIGDLFEVVFIQVKGGRARLPTPAELTRLRVAARHHRANAILLAVWKRGRQPIFYVLTSGRARLGRPSAAWRPADPGLLLR